MRRRGFLKEERGNSGSRTVTILGKARFSFEASKIGLVLVSPEVCDHRNF